MRPFVAAAALIALLPYGCSDSSGGGDPMGAPELRTTPEPAYTVGPDPSAPAGSACTAAGGSCTYVACAVEAPASGQDCTWSVCCLVESGGDAGERTAVPGWLGTVRGPVAR